MEKHFTSFEGDLYDTREHWNTKPIRSNYSRHHTHIKNVADFKATLRAGPFAWPGGYPLYFITSDGGALSFKTAREEFNLIAQTIADKANDGWQVIGCEINYEDDSLYCDHSSERIESAYGDD
tara:strand:+ start:937 stop:1305 length:369 start_codon:yes stop_codon:yes gene_type:complete